jgi:transcription elongation factor Elf1
MHISNVKVKPLLRRQYNMKAKTCDNCNSEIIVVKRGSDYVAECSYCGKPADNTVYFEDDYEGEDE